MQEEADLEAAEVQAAASVENQRLTAAVQAETKRLRQLEEETLDLDHAEGTDTAAHDDALPEDEDALARVALGAVSESNLVAAVSRPKTAALLSARRRCPTGRRCDDFLAPPPVTLLDVHKLVR